MADGHQQVLGVLVSAEEQVVNVRHDNALELGLVFVPEEPRCLVQSRPLPAAGLECSC